VESSWAVLIVSVSRLHLGKSRIICEGQKIHSSYILYSQLEAFDGSNSLPFNTYTIPKARLRGSDMEFWKQLRNPDSEIAKRWLEFDLYESSKKLVARLYNEYEDSTVVTLKRIITWSE